MRSAGIGAGTAGSAWVASLYDCQYGSGVVAVTRCLGAARSGGLPITSGTIV